MNKHHKRHKLAHLKGIILLVFISIAIISQAQEIVIPTKYNEKPLKRVLKYLENHYDVNFSYDSDLISKKTNKSDLQGKNMEDLLTKILNPHKLTFHKINNSYLILKSSKPRENLASIKKRDFKFGGLVIDKESREPLPYAFINFKNSLLWTSSNIDGYFSFNSIPNDTMTIMINYLGYETISTRLSEIDNVNYIVELREVGPVLEQVDITSTRSRTIEQKSFQKYYKVDPNQIDLISGNGQADIFKGLQLMSGVQTEDASSSDLNIRNSKESENLVLLDGVQIFHLSHFFGTYSTINQDYLKSIRLFKSTYGAEFGGKVGGVVDLSAREGDLKKVNAQIKTNLISTGIIINGPLLEDKSSFIFAIRHSHDSNLQSGLHRNLFRINFGESLEVDDLEVLNSNKNPTLVFHDINAKIVSKLNQSTKISLSLFNASDKYKNQLTQSIAISNSPGKAYDIESDDDSNWGSLAIAANISKQWNNNFHSSFHISNSTYHSNYTYKDKQSNYLFGNLSDEKNDSSITKNSINDLNFLLRTEWRKNKHLIKIGSEYHRYTIDNNSFLISQGSVSYVKKSNLEEESGLLNIYISDKYQISKKLSLEGGLRASRYGILKKTHILPRIEANLNLSKKWNLKISSGIYRQFIRKVSHERVSTNQPDEWRLSNTTTPSIESRQISSIISYEHKGWMFYLEAYAKSNTGSLINPNENIFRTIPNDLVTDYLVGSSKIMGSELTILKTKMNHSFWISLNRSTAYSTFDEINKGIAFSDLQNRLNDMKLNYQFHKKNWAFSISYIYSTGKTYTPVLGYFVNSITGDPYIVYGRDFSDRLPDYIRCDIGVKYSLKLGNNELKIGAGIYNLFNKKNISQRRYVAYPPSTSTDYQSLVRKIDLELLGISPNFSLALLIK